MLATNIGNEPARFGTRLFATPYKERIQKVLPILFNIVELENRRGNRLGMEVGNAPTDGAREMNAG